MHDDSQFLATWRDQDGNEYPWMVELWKWQDVQAAERKARGESSGRRLSDIPHAKLSNLLRCLDAAREAPEVWERAVWFANQPAIDPAELRLDDPRQAEADRQQQVVGFITRFAAWFRMKNEIDDVPDSYGNILLILGAMSKGQADRDDLPAMKQMFGPYFTVDDLSIGH